jgi:predicted NAD/FAD-dependent oxidoreductase
MENVKEDEEPWTIITHCSTNEYTENDLNITLPTNYTLDLVTNLAWSKVIVKCEKNISILFILL